MEDILNVRDDCDDLDFSEYWQNVSVDGEVLRGAKLREKKHRQTSDKLDVSLDGPTFHKEERNNLVKSQYPNCNGVPKLVKLHSKCKRKKKCYLRVMELATPTKRHCLNTWREQYKILPNFMVERLQKIVMDEKPIVRVADAVDCFQYRRTHNRPKYTRSESNKLKRVKRDIKLYSAVLQFKIVKRLLPSVIIDLSPRLDKICRIINEDIDYIKKKRRNSKLLNDPVIQSDIAKKVTLWIDDVLEESSCRLLLEDLKEFEEKEGPVLDLLDEIVENVVPPQLEFQSSTSSSSTIESQASTLLDEIESTENVMEIKSDNIQVPLLNTVNIASDIIYNILLKVLDNDVTPDDYIPDSVSFEQVKIDEELSLNSGDEDAGKKDIDNITDINNNDKDKLEKTKDGSIMANEVMNENLVDITIEENAISQNDTRYYEDNYEIQNNETDTEQNKPEQTVNENIIVANNLTHENKREIESDIIINDVTEDKSVKDINEDNVTKNDSNENINDDDLDKTLIPKDDLIENDDPLTFNDGGFKPNELNDELEQETADDSLKKVKFHDSYMGIINKAMRDIAERADDRIILNTKHSDNNKETTSDKITKSFIVFASPNNNLLSPADEIWPTDLNSSIKPSASVCKSIASLGRITETDERTLTLSTDNETHYRLVSESKASIETYVVYGDLSENKDFAPSNVLPYDTSISDKNMPWYLNILQPMTDPVMEENNANRSDDVIKDINISQTEKRRLLSATEINKNVVSVVREAEKSSIVVPIPSTTNILYKNGNVQSISGTKFNKDKKGLSDHKKSKSVDVLTNNIMTKCRTCKEISEIISGRKQRMMVVKNLSTININSDNVVKNTNKWESQHEKKIKASPQKFDEPDPWRWCMGLQNVCQNLELWANWIEEATNRISHLRGKDSRNPIKERINNSKRWRKLKADINSDSILWLKMSCKLQGSMKSYKTYKYQIPDTCTCYRRQISKYM